MVTDPMQTQDIVVVFLAFTNLVVISILLGVEDAIVHKEYSFDVFKQGLLKHVVTLIIVALVGMDAMLFDYVKPPWPKYMYDLAVFVFALNYVMGIVEKLDKLHIYIPQFILDYIEMIKKGDKK